MDELRAWQAKGTPTLLSALAAVGAVAGLLSWGLAYIAGPFFGMPQPNLVTLVGAVIRGAAFGVIMGLGLSWYWRRKPRP